MVPWLRNCLLIQGTCVQSLVRELRSHPPGATKAVWCSYQAHVPQLERRLHARKGPTCREQEPAQPRINQVFKSKISAKTRTRDLKGCSFQCVFTSPLIIPAAQNRRGYSSIERNPPTFAPKRLRLNG